MIFQREGGFLINNAGNAEQQGEKIIHGMTLSEFIRHPDTVDFILRGEGDINRFIMEHPNVVVTQTLSGRYVICYANRDDFNSIIAVAGTSFLSSISIVLGTLDRASLEAAGILQVQQQPYLDLKGQGVLIGIVDTGIDYTLPIFRYEDGSTKIKYIYDQTLDTNRPPGFIIGTEYNEETINEALRSENPFSIVPEQDTSGHGTFLASLAAGREIDNFIGAAPEAELIIVKLKKTRPFYLEWYSVPPDQNDAFESSSVMLGVEYVIDKARELGRPVIVCLGLGSNFGSHDGFTLFEEYLNGVSNLHGVCLCVAAGNESQARHHMQGIISSQNESQNIDLRVGNNAGDIFISIWNGVGDRMSVSIRSPTGELVGRVSARPGSITDTQLILEKSRVRVEYHFPVEGSSGQLTIIRIFNVTPGIWTITVYGDIILDGTFNAWLPMTGFIAPNVEFLAATPYTTITVPGTAIGALCIGAYNSENNSLYARTSWGPTRVGVMAPDFVAPGVDIGGYYPTGYGLMSGTSAATAITAGACALLMQWGVVEGKDPSLSTYQIRAYLIRGCERSDAIIYPNTQWGYGTLNLLKSFQLMREL